MSICRPHGSSSSMLSVATHGAVMSFCLSLLVTFVSSAITELFEMQADFSGPTRNHVLYYGPVSPRGRGRGRGNFWESFSPLKSILSQCCGAAKNSNVLNNL